MEGKGRWRFLFVVSVPPLRNHAKMYRRSERGERGGGLFGKTTKRGGGELLVVCLLRLLMAVLGRVRNWRVCTRSLYTAFLFLSPFTLPWSLPLCLPSPPFLPYLIRRRTCRPFFFHGTTVSRSFFRRRDFRATRFVCFLELVDALCRVVSFRVISSFLLLPFPYVYSVVYSSWIRVRDSSMRHAAVFRWNLLSILAPLMIFRRLAVWLRSSFSTRARSNSSISNLAFQTRLL